MQNVAIILIVAIVGSIDILGRVLTLLYMMNHSEVKKWTYKNWVILVALLNFAFVAYWIINGKGKQK